MARVIHGEIPFPLWPQTIGINDLDRQSVTHGFARLVPIPTGHGPTGAYLAKIMKRHRFNGTFHRKQGESGNADILDGTSEHDRIE